ncbi:MAG: hypothetical protein ONB37_04490 [candidate division KSB1 bacterium]|nr:hypothetical protein [candidate division KSB1 bacterium]
MIRTKTAQANYITQLALMFILGGLAGLVYVMLTPMWWLVFLGMATLVAVFISNRVGFLIILATLFIFNWLFGVLRVIPKEITWLPDVILIILTAKVAFLQAGEKRFKGTPIDMAILAIILLGIISAMYNTVSPFTVILGFRNFFKYVLMFYILRNIEPNEKFYRLFFWLLFIFALIQIPVTIMQALYYGNIGEDIADNVSGTLGWRTTGAMAVFMGFFASMLAGLYVQQRKLVFLFLGALSFIPVILGSGLFGFYIIPPATLISLIFGYPKTLKNLFKLISLIGIMSVLIWTGINFHDHFYQGKLAETIRSPKKFYRFNLNYRKEGTFGRFQAVKVANDLLSQHLPHLMIGFGPGNASDSFFSQYKGRLEKQFQGRKISGVQLSVILLEFGYIGLALFLYLFYRLLKINSIFYKATQSDFWKSISIGYNGMVFCYIAAVIYNPAWFFDVLAFTFWFISAAIVIRSDKYLEGSTDDRDK